MVSTKFGRIIKKLQQHGLAETVTWKKRGVTDDGDSVTNEPEIDYTEQEEIVAVIRPTGVTEFFDDLKAELPVYMIFTASQIEYLDAIFYRSQDYQVQPVEDNSEIGYYSALLKPFSPLGGIAGGIEMIDEEGNPISVAEGLKWAYFSHTYIWFGEPQGDEYGGAYFSNEFVDFGELEGDGFGGAYFNVE